MCVVCLYLFGYNYKKRPFVFCYGYRTFPGPIEAWIPCKSGHGDGRTLLQIRRARSCS